MGIDIVARKRLGRPALQPPALFPEGYEAEWQPLQGGMEALLFSRSACARGMIVDVYQQGKRIEISQPLPTTDAELRALFGMVERLLLGGYQVQVDGKRVNRKSLAMLRSSCMYDNRRILQSLIAQGFDGFPCVTGAEVKLTGEDRERLREDTAAFADILHAANMRHLAGG